jgi:hypothetical protein
VAEKIAHVFDDLACSHKNEGSIPFTRATLSSANSQFFRALLYEAAWISSFSLRFQPQN